MALYPRQLFDVWPGIFQHTLATPELIYVVYESLGVDVTMAPQSAAFCLSAPTDLVNDRFVRLPPILSRGLRLASALAVFPA